MSLVWNYFRKPNKKIMQDLAQSIVIVPTEEEDLQSDWVIVKSEDQETKRAEFAPTLQMKEIEDEEGEPLEEPLRSSATAEGGTRSDRDDMLATRAHEMPAGVEAPTVAEPVSGSAPEAHRPAPISRRLTAVYLGMPEADSRATRRMMKRVDEGKKKKEVKKHDSTAMAQSFAKKERFRPWLNARESKKGNKRGGSLKV